MAAFLIAFLWLYFNQKIGLKKSFTKIFNPRIFFSKSSFSDYKLFILNQIIMVIISPILVAQLTIATFLFYYFHSISWLDSGMFSHLSTTLIVISFTSVHFILDDFTKFYIHK